MPNIDELAELLIERSYDVLAANRIEDLRTVDYTIMDLEIIVALLRNERQIKARAELARGSLQAGSLAAP